tara:strand:+ start:1472 stop:1597 length:126 start_codon:yes stop_codon:yes gene_type:complete
LVSHFVPDLVAALSYLEEFDVQAEYFSGEAVISVYDNFVFV